MMRGLVAACLLAIAVRGRADEPPESWVEGTRLLQIAQEKLQAGKPSRADFRRAAAALVKAVRPSHPETFLNLGNAHYLAGELPEAIAAFSAGLSVDPADGRLHENLLCARRDVTLSADAKLVAPPSSWQRYLFQSWLGSAAAIALAASCVLVPASLRLGRWRCAAIGVGLAVIAAVGGIAIFIRTEYLDDLDRRPVCVLRVDAPLRTGNAERYASHPDVSLLPRGYEVRRLGQRGAWVHVECPGGQIGWVPLAKLISFGRY